MRATRRTNAALLAVVALVTVAAGLVQEVAGFRFGLGLRRFPVEDAPHLLLATAVGGAPLSPGHGGPRRLVAPGRRGFWWVKWVAAVELSQAPAWRQPPFPLQ